MKKVVFLITPGSIFGVEGDPSHWPADIMSLIVEVRRAKLLPAAPSRVISGTGRRFRDIARTLELRVDRFTPVIGGAEYPHMMGGQYFVRLSSGEEIPDEQFTGQRDNSPAALRVLREAPDQSVLITGRGYAEALFGSDCPVGPIVVRVDVIDGVDQNAELLNPAHAISAETGSV